MAFAWAAGYRNRMTRPVLLVPGIGNSGPDHWQSAWERRHALVTRVAQRDWDHPHCAEWLEALDAEVVRLGPQTLLVAHSLACLLVAHWAARSPRPVRAALLVAVPDPTGLAFPAAAVGFGDVPRTRLPFDTTIVCSTDDPYSSLAFVRRCAGDWDAELVDAGSRGHLNAASGLGDWDDGWALVERWREG